MALNININKKTVEALKTKNSKGDTLSQVKVYKGFDVDKSLKGVSYIKLILSGSWASAHIYNPTTTDQYISINRVDVVKSIKLFIDAVINGVDNNSFKQIKADEVSYKRLVKVKEFITTLK